jgi:Protein kinase domain
VDPLQVSDPEIVGRYRLLGRLGAGGMGRVYLGVTPDGGQAAVKVIRDDLADDTRFRHRFRREVVAASAVAGMFTARVLDADPDGDPPWLATQYVEGLSLRDAVLRNGPMPEGRLVALAQGIAEALAAIHAAGLTHRDLKPANVILSPAGPKVIDFGIARAADSTQLTGTGQVVGTPDFMAPEQIEGTGDSGPPGDVFALGSTLAYAATGRGPFGAEQTAATLYKILNAEPDLRGVPPRVAPIIAGCLAKQPAQRPTAVQLAVTLRAGLGTAAAGTSAFPATAIGTPGLATGAPPPTVTGPGTATGSAGGSGARRRRGIAAAVLVALAVAATVITVVWTTAAGRDNSAGAPTTTVAATPTATSTIDPNSPEARYVDRLCASGDLLTALGNTPQSTVTTGDPAVAKRNFLADLDRSIATTDVLLSTFTTLRDDAPNDQIRAQTGEVVAEFTAARDKYAEARATVAASEPLTITAYRKGNDLFRDGTRNLSLGANLIKSITLPKGYTDASAVAPRCNNPD